MLEPYIQLSEIHDECVKKATNEPFLWFHPSIQKFVLDLSKDIQPDDKAN